MIKIKPYYERPLDEKEKILNRYLYLAAMVLPFPPDVVAGTALEVDGKPIDLSKLQKPRTRDDAYRKVLVSYGITPAAKKDDETGRLREDQLLAARIIREASPQLYGYLYEATAYTVPASVPPMKKDHVRRLLTVRMGDLDDEMKKIGEIKDKKGKSGKKVSEELLKFVFRYDSFASRKQAVLLLKDLGVNVCPYCNRIYTVTLTKKGHKSRPQFDHYKSKVKYPYFAVSLMNLIPSCGLCNQAKGDKAGEVLYPYSDEMGKDVVFRAKDTAGLTYLTGCPSAENEFRIELEEREAGSISKELRDKVNHSDKIFHLTELYNEHKDYVLYLYRKRYFFSDDYLETLCAAVPALDGKSDELKGLLYLMDLEQSEWGKRSLAKLTHDIDQQIEEE